MHVPLSTVTRAATRWVEGGETRTKITAPHHQHDRRTSSHQAADSCNLSHLAAVNIRAGDEPSRSLKFHNHGEAEAPDWKSLLVLSHLRQY